MSRAKQRDVIAIEDLEVFLRVGVPDEERAQPQRLLISVRMETDIRLAAASDDLVSTIDYAAVAARVEAMGRDGQWRLIETLAEDVSAMVLETFRPLAVEVSIQKFILPKTRFVSVTVRRECDAGAVIEAS